MKTYKFYGCETRDVKPIDKEFEKIQNQRHLYDLLDKIWDINTCSPFSRDKWNINDKTVGQCAITSFLTQDIFGGDVLGIPLGNGRFHCFNKIGNVVFDLTSEQFHGEKLDYVNVKLQEREIHFQRIEKKERYEMLKANLLKLLMEL